MSWCPTTACMYCTQVLGARYRPRAGPPLHPYLPQPVHRVGDSKVKHGPIGGRLDKPPRNEVTEP